jgi:hypothetical protein
VKAYLFSYRKLLSWAALAGASMSTLQAQEPSTPRVTVQEKAAGAEVRINQVETSEFPKVTLFATVLKDGVIDPQSGKRVGSYFFEQVHDFYEDKMTQATWNVSRAPTGLGKVRCRGA